MLAVGSTNAKNGAGRSGDRSGNGRDSERTGCREDGMSSKKDASQVATTNGAWMLLNFFMKLRAMKKERDQRSALVEAFDIPTHPPHRVTATLHHRLASLSMLPHSVRRSIVEIGAHPGLFEWEAHVSAAIDRLDGGTGTPIARCFDPGGQALVTALSELRMVAVFLDVNGSSYDRTRLEQLLATIDELLEGLASKCETEDTEVYDWLTETLQSMRDVVEVALSLGMEAARERLYTLAGRMGFNPKPPAATDAGNDWYEKVKKVAEALTVVMRLDQFVGKIFGFLSNAGD